MALKCGNNGCGKTFNQEDNNDTACIHHSGTAVFHEGMKGWSCCKKRVISFEEFMDIPGCSCGAHVPEQKKPQVSGEEGDGVERWVNITRRIFFTLCYYNVYSSFLSLC